MNTPLSASQVIRLQGAQDHAQQDTIQKKEQGWEECQPPNPAPVTGIIKLRQSHAFTGRPKTAIYCVSEKIQTAYVCLNTPRVLDFFASLYLTIFERPANFEFLSNQFRSGSRRSGQ
jgi:hypothetical protein